MPAITAEAIRTLGKLPSPQAVEALAKIAATEYGAVAVEAINALGLHLASNPRRQRALPTLALQVLARRRCTRTRFARSQAGGTVGPGRQLRRDAMAARYSTKRSTAREPASPTPANCCAIAPIKACATRRCSCSRRPASSIPRNCRRSRNWPSASATPTRGKQLLAASLKGETQCLRCHTVRGVGGNIGPDLSMIGKKASRENLFESILLPSKAIADQYLQWKIENDRRPDRSSA